MSEEPTTTEPEVSVGEVGDTLSVENADGPLGDITVTKVRSAAATSRSSAAPTSARSWSP